MIANALHNVGEMVFREKPVAQATTVESHYVDSLQCLDTAASKDGARRRAMPEMHVEPCVRIEQADHGRLPAFVDRHQSVALPSVLPPVPADLAVDARQLC